MTTSKPMVVGIIGSRNFKKMAGGLGLIKTCVGGLPPGTTVVSGGAVGPDTYSVNCAKACGLKTKVFWPVKKTVHESFYKAAFRRNTQIAEAADWVIAFWSGDSTGTKDTIDKAIAMEKRVTIILPNGATYDEHA